MKYFILCIFFIKLVLPLKAQVLIEAADLPAPGKAFAIYQIGGGSLSSSFNSPRGPNQTWDYSLLQSSNPEADTVRYILAGESPFGKDFPASTMAEVTNLNTRFYSVGPAEVHLLGQHDSISTRLQPPLLFSRLPIAYGNITRGTGSAVIEFPYRDTVQSPFGPIIVTAARVTITIIKTDTVDSWGSIKTPAGQYQAIRIFTTTQINQKLEGRTNFGWVESPQQPAPSYSRQFSWWAKGIGKEVFSVQLSGRAGNNVQQIAWLQDNVSDPLRTRDMTAPDAFAVGPNPTTGTVQLTGTFPITEGSTFKLFNLNGEVVDTGTYTGEVKIIDLSHLPVGIYELQIISGGKSVSTKKLLLTR